ncbi:MAG: hypothetical protein RCO49_01230 [Rickettsia endosymbiont of Argas persicus]
MKTKNLFIDSSDEEKENQVVKKFIKTNYSSYLLNDLLNIQNILNADDFKIKLGLILHNLADRLFKNSLINDTYQNIKIKELSLSESNYNNLLNSIKTIFKTKWDQLFIDNSKENPITDKDYIQLFNFLFDKNIKLPQIFTLKDSITITEVKETLLDEIHLSSDIDLQPLFQDPLNIKLNLNNPVEILAYSKITNRNNKNKIKYLTVQKTDKYSSTTIYKLPNIKLPAFTDSHVIHYKTGNVQTEKFGFGNYKDIFQEILQNDSYRKDIVERIFEVVQNKSIKSTLKLPKELNNFAEQLTHLLFIIEMQRNNATLFTAPMFLELIAKDNKYLKDEKFFPMSAKTAVSQARGISKDYLNKLPNTHFMDYDTNNIKNSHRLLSKEGSIFFIWLDKIINNNKLTILTHTFDCYALVKFITNKETDKLSLKNIQNFLEDIYKIENYPKDILKTLEENLHNIIPYFGSRSEQYLKLAKENLLEKTIFSGKVKNLINTTFSEFQKVIPKLESFLAKVQENFEEDIKKIIPEILQILSSKLKEWYNIETPEYIKLPTKNSMKRKY